MTKHDLARLAATTTLTPRRVPLGYGNVKWRGGNGKPLVATMIDAPDYIPPARRVSVPAAKGESDCYVPSGKDLERIYIMRADS